MEVNYVASWRPGADKIYKKVNAQKVAEEIIEAGGTDNLEAIKAETVVDMARDETKECHKIFEWNNDVAAEKYRITQARHLMHDIHIVKIKTGKKKSQKIEVPVRMFYNLKGEVGYHPTPVIIQNEDLHAKLLMTARSELEAFIEKYRVLSELEPLLTEIEKLIVELKVFDKIA